MRRREVRAARLDVVEGKRKPMTLEQMAQLFAPANDPDPQGDEAWLDAIAEANSGTQELNRRDE